MDSIYELAKKAMVMPQLPAPPVNLRLDMTQFSNRIEISHCVCGAEDCTGQYARRILGGEVTAEAHFTPGGYLPLALFGYGGEHDA